VSQGVSIHPVTLQEKSQTGDSGGRIGKHGTCVIWKLRNRNHAWIPADDSAFTQKQKTASDSPA